MNSTASLPTVQPLLLQLLLRRRILDPKKLDAVREAKLRDKRPLEEILVGMGLVSDRDIAAVYAEHFALPLLEATESAEDLNRDLAKLLPEKLCRDQLIAPVAIRGDTLELAFATPNEMLILDEVQLLTGLNVQPFIAPISVIETLIANLYYGGRWSEAEFRRGAEDFEQLEDDQNRVDELGDDQDDETLHLDQPPPPGRDGRIIRLVNQILEHAFRVGASDIHLEPFEDGCKIRLRIDGVLNEIPPPPRALFIPIVSRFKVLAKMDIAEKRVPQDGAIALRTGDRRMDLRMSTMPTVHGEKVVIRVLDKSAIPLQLTELGLDERQAKDLSEAIQMPHGLLLVTGPTGSGKSTTLYACLNLLNNSVRNISTVEDPVEYKFSGVNQVQVKTQVGLTFANTLRSLLRQDPDVIMVGEVRDPETAEICLRAALTGHLVLSTLHTNDALSAITRLQDMGIEPFLLASSLRVLGAQRLIRRLCQECKEPYDCDKDTANLYGLEPGETVYRPKGCENCRDSGYRGRLGAFEVVRITSHLATLIQTRKPLPELRKAAREQGIRPLFDCVMENVRKGITSLEEALRVTIAAED